MESSDVDGSWQLWTVAEEMIWLGLLGKELPVEFWRLFTNLPPQFTSTERAINGPWGYVNIAFFIELYISYVLLNLILLLNLLIALMGTTYQEHHDNMVIEYRVAFTRNILKYEMLAQIPPRWKHIPQGDRSFCGLFQLEAGIPTSCEAGKDGECA